jgi:hypothetical protein
MNCLIVKRLMAKYDETDIKEYLRRENLFKGGSDEASNRMDFEAFKKAYFPHLFHIHEDDMSEEEHEDLVKLKEGVKKSED